VVARFWVGFVQRGQKASDFRMVLVGQRKAMVMAVRRIILNLRLESATNFLSAQIMIQSDLVISEFGRYRLAGLAFHGFDDDPRELHCIPEVRRFVREFRRILPYWLYFCCPAKGLVENVSSLPLLATCCLERLGVVQVEGASLCGVDCDPEAVRRFLASLLPAFKLVADRARVFPDVRRQHLIEHYTAFNLTPDDAVFAAAGA
jgi:hypothetical protein